MLSSVTLAGIALALPTLPRSATGDLAALLDACALALRSQYATPGGVVASVLGVAVVLAVVARLAQRAILTALEVRRTRRRQLGGLMLVGNVRRHPGVHVVHDPRPAIYCLPGRRGRIVATTTALDRLPAEQLGVVLAHERAHLRARHDLVVLFTEVLATAFPFVPVFRAARDRVPALLEMAADDSAVRCGSRHDLARALVTLAEGQAPVGTLGAGGSSALSRVIRLSRPAQRLGRGRSGLVLLGLVLALAGPVAIAAAPALAAAAMDYCPMPIPV